MALAVSIFSETGLLLASDNHLLCLAQAKGSDQPQIMVNRRAKLTYLCPNQAGISFTGPAVVDGHSAEATMQEFIRERVKKDTQVEDIPWMLLDEFGRKGEIADYSFLVAGYQGEKQKLIKVHARDKSCEMINTERGGITWIGEGNQMARLFLRCGLEKEEGQWMPLPPNRIVWSMLGEQSRIVLVKRLLDLSGVMSSLMAGAGSVGETADILLIRRDGTEWFMKNQEKCS